MRAIGFGRQRTRLKMKIFVTLAFTENRTSFSCNPLCGILYRQVYNNKLKMKITQKDFDETTELAGLLTKIDNFSSEDVDTLSDEIFKRQPFFLTVLLGYRFDVTPEELEEIMKIYFLIWEYFKTNKNVQTKPVTESYFEKVQDRHIKMLKYVEGETTQNDKMNIYSYDLDNLKSKALITAVLYRYNSRPTLLKMDKKSKGIVLVGIKSFIECFETI